MIPAENSESRRGPINESPVQNGVQWELSVVFGSPEEREFAHNQDHSKASRMASSIFEREILEGKIQTWSLMKSRGKGKETLT